MLLVEKERPPSRARRRFTKEFKDDAVALVLDGDRPIARVAHVLGVGATSLGDWVRQARIDRGEEPGLTTEERSELVRLRRENSKLRMKRELPCERRPFGFRSRATGPLLVGPCPEGRGVPDHSRVPGCRREPPGVLRLVRPPEGGALPCRAGRGRTGRRDTPCPRRLRRGLRVAQGHSGAAPPRPAGEPQTGLPAHETPRHLRHTQKAQAPLEGVPRCRTGSWGPGAPRLPPRPP